MKDQKLEQVQKIIESIKDSMFIKLEMGGLDEGDRRRVQLLAEKGLRLLEEAGE